MVVKCTIEKIGVPFSVLEQIQDRSAFTLEKKTIMAKYCSALYIYILYVYVGAQTANGTATSRKTGIPS